MSFFNNVTTTMSPSENNEIKFILLGLSIGFGIMAVACALICNGCFGQREQEDETLLTQENIDHYLFTDSSPNP